MAKMIELIVQEGQTAFVNPLNVTHVLIIPGGAMFNFVGGERLTAAMTAPTVLALLNAALAL